MATNDGRRCRMASTRRDSGMTISMAINAWVDRHPYLGFLVFLGITFGLMALCGLSDGPDRVRALGGM